MARQAVVVVALALLATLASAADSKPKATLPTFAPVPGASPSPVTTDNNAVGTTDAAGDAPTTAQGPSVSEAIAAGVGGPVSEKTFGNAQAPKSGATPANVSAGAALTAVAAASFFFF